jgi:hypothetical protein
MIDLILRGVGFGYFLLTVFMILSGRDILAHPPPYNNFGLSINRAVNDLGGNFLLYAAPFPGIVALALLTLNRFVIVFSLAIFGLGFALIGGLALVTMQILILLLALVFFTFCLVPLLMAYFRPDS